MLHELAKTCRNCGEVPQPGSPMGLCSRCLMVRLGEPDESPTIAAVTAAEDPDQPGHAVVGQIARGGMGNILEVQDRTLDRSVAMKVVRPDARDSSSTCQRFEREAAVLARLEHPNIVPIYEQGRDAAGNSFYTMKLVRGRTLQAILNDLKAGQPDTTSRWKLDDLLNAFQKIGDAVAFAHSRGIIHRDLKPENVMVGEFGEVLVMDWGLAKLLDDSEKESKAGDLPSADVKPDSALTLDGAVLGTPQFMPPEQAGGRTEDIDTRADIFSLGAILYSVLTLRPPIRGKSIAAILDQVRSGSIKAPSSYNRQRRIRAEQSEATDKGQEVGKLRHCPGGRIPEALSKVTMRAMQTDPDHRYPSVSALLEDIVAYQRGFATSQQQLGAFGQLWLLIKRQRLASGMVAIMLIMAVAFVVQLMASVERERKQAELAEAGAGRARLAEARARAEQRKAVLEKEATRVGLGRATIALADSAYRAGDADGLWMHLNACPEDLRDSTWRYLARSFQDPGKDLPEMAGRSTWNAALNRATKDRFVTVDATGDVWEIDGSTGAARIKFPVTERGRVAVAISPDGKTLAVAGQRSRKFRLLDFDTGELIAEGRLPKGTIEIIKFSQEGDRLLLRGASPYVLYCLSVRTGKQLWTARAGSLAVAVDPSGRWIALDDPKQDEVIVLDAADGSPQLTLPKLGMTRITRLSFGPEGGLLAAGDSNGNVRVWNLPDRSPRLRLKLGSESVQMLGITKAGSLITMLRTTEGVIRNTLQIFSLNSGRRIDTHFGIPADAAGGYLHPDSGQILFSGSRPSLRRYVDGRETFTISGNGVSQAVGFLDEERLFSSSDSHQLALIDTAADAKVRWHPRERVSPAHSVAASVGMAVVAGQNGRRQDYYCLQLGSHGRVTERIIPSLPGPVSGIHLADDGRRMLLAIRNGGIFEVAIDTGKTKAVVAQKDRSPGRLIRYCNGGSHLVVITDHPEMTGDKVELWQLNPPRLERSEAIGYHVRSIAVDAAGKHLAVVGNDWNVRIFDTLTLGLECQFRAHDQDILAVAFHPDLPWLATGSSDLTVKLWDRRDGRLLDRFIGSGQDIVSLSFSPSGKLLAAGCADQETRVWPLAKDL